MTESTNRTRTVQRFHVKWRNLRTEGRQFSSIILDFQGRFKYCNIFDISCKDFQDTNFAYNFSFKIWAIALSKGRGRNYHNEEKGRKDHSGMKIKADCLLLNKETTKNK